MTTITRHLLTIALLLLWQPLAADDQETADTSKPDSREQQEASSTGKPSDTPIFKPSEEISEDLSVPFPIDI